MKQEEMTPFSPEVILVFVGHSNDATEEAKVVIDLEHDLQRELEQLLQVSAGSSQFKTIRMWEWNFDAPSKVGGQARVITPTLQRANVAVFVFKERIGIVTWMELQDCVGRTEDPIPVIAVFPDFPPDSTKMKDVKVVSDWQELLTKKMELTSDWVKPNSKSVRPIPDYRDKNHLKEIVFNQVKHTLPELMRAKHNSIAQPRASRKPGFIADYKHLTYDRRPVLRYGVERLDRQLIETFLSKPLSQDTARRAGLRQPSVLDHLKLLGCLHEEGPTLGAFLCFAPSSLIVDKFDSCSLHMVIYDKNTKADSNADITIVKDNLLNLMEEGIAWLTTRSGLRRLGIVGTSDRDELEIPEIALREALANALVHRDYEHPELKEQPTRIEVHPDRVLITSFGRLPETISVEQLNNDPENVTPIRRNPILAKIFNHMTHTELNASGISRMRSATKRLSLPPPKITSKNNVVRVEFARKQLKFLPPDKISFAKLPSSSPDLFGREKELKVLDGAWEDQQINLISLVAWGGVGKSALVNKWLSQMARDDYRGAERIYGWSFYSQGAAEGRQVSADQFIAAALEWFGDPDVTKGSPWDKGERLAELIKQQRTLLILDGLEPLQNPPPVETGKIKDPGLTSLLRELARQNPGLVVITTRVTVDDLKDFNGNTATEIDLENLSADAGAAYLKHLGVDGTDDERKDAAKDFGGHALGLTLMGSYLKVVHRGDIRKRREIPHVMDEQKQGAQARRVMESYERWLNGKPELDILRLMSLFNHSAGKGELDTLREKPVIEGLTGKLQKLKDADWQFAVNNLRDLGLLLNFEAANPDVLDCEPLLREYFGEKLKVENPNAWREAHRRLYEFYKSVAKESPDKLEEIAPLFVAIMHGCEAGRHQEALNEIFWQRIRREHEAFSLKNLGAFGADLAALSSFFDPPWHKPVDGLSEDWKGFVLNEAGFDLRALGRLPEAAQPIQASLDAYIAQNNWNAAAITTINLSELYLTIGDVTHALTYAKQSVELADRSSDALQQKGSRTTLADVLHQAGSLTEAETAFREAEEMQKKDQPELPLLYSLPGFQYCDLLLSQGKYQEVQRRAGQTLESQTRYSRDLLKIGLDNLSLGRAYLLNLTPQPSPTRRGEGGQGTIAYLNRAVDGLRQAGDQEMIARGLFARAEYYRLTGTFDKARRDLDEAFTIATRGGMGLHLADCHLEYARLYLARGDKAKAREHWEIAKDSIEKMGYHRRDKEVEEIEE